tara:strand:- start:580 stop:864 length:285 start_codon:yes stop_codon:yes gene_type:complete
MYASDLAKIIHLFVVSKINTSFNVAPDINMSIEDIAISAIKVCDNSKLKIKYDSSKPNGQHRKDVDTTIFKNQIKDFKFKTLTQGIKEIYAHYK